MIKLTDLLKEEETFTAVNKASGETSVFKSKDSRDAAVKAGTHDKKEKEAEKGGDSAGKEKPNMFSKDTGYDAPDDDYDDDDDDYEIDDSDEDNIELPKEVEAEFEKELGTVGYDWADIGAIPGVISYMDKDENAIMISTGAAYGGDEPFYVSGYNLPDMEDGESDETNGKSFDTKEDAMAYAKELAQKLKGGESKEEPKEEPTKDSTKERAGNPKVNKVVRDKAKKLGVTPQKLGKEEYESRMSKAAVEALTDANFHSEARKLIAVLEDNPDFAKDPNQDPKKPKDIFSDEYDEWRKNSVYSSTFYDSAEGTDDIAHSATGESGWDGIESLDAIAFDLKMNGSKKLAAKLQSIFEGKTSKGFKNHKIGGLR
jgi:hypothetical protein